jgi:thiosulfate/3-mercaptopyruvate sulfurtransferase
MLIDTAELARHLGEPGWILFDCRHDLMDFARGAALYRQGHLPGACFADVETDLSGAKTGRNGRHPLPRPEDFAAFLSRHGVGPESTVVAYDQVGGQYAARLLWLARWIGHAKVAVLDGGFPKWEAEGRPLVAGPIAPQGGGGILARPDPSHLLTVEVIEACPVDRSWLVLDARSPERFRGESEPIDAVAGHIPGAANHYFQDNLRADLTFRPSAELRAAFAQSLRGHAPDRVVHQCGSGITACANLLAMEHAGLSGSRLYPGSWSEWIAETRRPVARGE